MKSPKRHTITAALPYANGPLHLGHLAGVYISADIYARFLRSSGEDVAFICGSDEHGAAITLRAKKEEKSPRSRFMSIGLKRKDERSFTLSVKGRVSINKSEQQQDFS